MRVWVAAPDEVESIARLLAEFRDWFGRDEPSDGRILESVRLLVDDPGTEYLLGAGDAAGRPAGVCQLRFRYGIWHSAEDCWLEDLYVSERARGAGVGSALAEAAVERARARGCRRVELDVDADNDAALALYERVGFSTRTASGASRLMARLPLSPPS